MASFRRGKSSQEWGQCRFRSQGSLSGEELRRWRHGRESASLFSWYVTPAPGRLTRAGCLLHFAADWVIPLPWRFRSRQLVQRRTHLQSQQNVGDEEADEQGLHNGTPDKELAASTNRQFPDEKPSEVIGRHAHPCHLLSALMQTIAKSELSDRSAGSSRALEDRWPRPDARPLASQIPWNDLP